MGDGDIYVLQGLCFICCTCVQTCCFCVRECEQSRGEPIQERGKNIGLNKISVCKRIERWANVTQRNQVYLEKNFFLWNFRIDSTVSVVVVSGPWMKSSCHKPQRQQKDFIGSSKGRIPVSALKKWGGRGGGGLLAKKDQSSSPVVCQETCTSLGFIFSMVWKDFQDPFCGKNDTARSCEQAGEWKN